MSGDGGSPPSLRDLLGTYEKSGLAALGQIISKEILIGFLLVILNRFIWLKALRRSQNVR